MSLLDDASLLLTPNAEKATKLYSIIPSNGNGDFTVSRATTATRTNSSGLIESTPINEPRLDYSLGSCPNILLEPQRTNLALRSEEFDNTSWNALNLNITANNIVSPSGVQNADLFTETANDRCRIAPTNVQRAGDGTAVTMSFYYKAGTRRYIQPINGSGGVSYYGCMIDTVTNTIVNNGFIGSATFISSSITSVGNGWYRVSLSGTNPVGTNSTFQIYGSDTSTLTYQTAVCSGFKTFYIWGAQLEVGAYATSYIPTTSASVTRNQDIISRGNIYTNGLITASGGTWFVDLRNNRVLSRDTTLGGLFLNTGTAPGAGDGLTFRNLSPSTRIQLQKVVSGVLTNLFGVTTDNPKIAIKWNGTTADVFVDGVKVVSATSFTPTAMENLIGNGANIALNINSTALFPTPLTDAQCIALTT